MKSNSLFNQISRLLLGWVFLLGAVFAHADTETGYYRVGVIGDNPYVANYLIIENKTAVTPGTGTARCGSVAGWGTFVGNGTVAASLAATGSSFQGNQAMYSMLLAADLAGKQVSIVYNYNTTASYAYNCLLMSVTIN